MMNKPLTDVPCKGCKRPCHPHYAKKYHGYCLECFNAGVPERDAKIAELEAEVARLQWAKRKDG